MADTSFSQVGPCIPAQPGSTLPGGKQTLERLVGGCVSQTWSEGRVCVHEQLWVCGGAWIICSSQTSLTSGITHEEGDRKKPPESKQFGANLFLFALCLNWTEGD